MTQSYLFQWVGNMDEQFNHIIMEDIRKKAKDDELNLEKAKDIHKQPRKFIPVPKVIKGKKK